MKKVLVFPCGSEIGLEIFKSLRYSIHFEIWGGSSVQDHGEFVYKNYVGNMPQVNDDGFVEAINRITNENKIDYIFPAHDDVVLALSRAQANGTLLAKVLTAPVNTCEITRSKRKTYEHFFSSIPTPKIYSNISSISDDDWPVFLKPDVGQGSKGTHLANSKSEAEHYLEHDKSLLILENLPGNEYTIDCFTNRHGQLLFCEGRQRQRILNGISVNSSTVDNDKFRVMALSIAEKLNMRGVWFYQVKERQNGELVLMEVAPRVAGTMGLVRAKGVNLPLLTLFDAMDMDVEILENNENVVIDRALENTYRRDISYEHVYLDLDDLTIINNRVNPSVLAFVYQCHNKGVKVHLITKHKEDVNKTLEKYRLSGIFDEVIAIDENDEKHPYISEASAIFIDDSFAERKKVHEQCHIPVFDAHMIESLMEKF